MDTKAALMAPLLRSESQLLLVLFFLPLSACVRACACARVWLVLVAVSAAVRGWLVLVLAIVVMVVRVVVRVAVWPCDELCMQACSV